MKKISPLSLFISLGFLFNAFSSYGLTFQEKEHIAGLLLKVKCKIIKNNNFLQEKIDILQEEEDSLKKNFLPYDHKDISPTVQENIYNTLRHNLKEKTTKKKKVLNMMKNLRFLRKIFKKVSEHLEQHYRDNLKKFILDIDFLGSLDKINVSFKKISEKLTKFTTDYAEENNIDAQSIINSNNDFESYMKPIILEKLQLPFLEKHEDIKIFSLQSILQEDVFR